MNMNRQTNGKTIEYLTDIELEQLNHFLISSELTEGSHVINREYCCGKIDVQ